MTARSVALVSLATALVLNLIEVVADPNGAWWTTMRAAASFVFTVGAVAWLGLWIAERRRGNDR